MSTVSLIDLQVFYLPFYTSITLGPKVNDKISHASPSNFYLSRAPARKSSFNSNGSKDSRAFESVKTKPTKQNLKLGAKKFTSKV